MALNKDISKLLLNYQIKHTTNLIYSLNRYNRALDASDTGTGKTYSAVACAKQLNLKPLIICPKSVISAWINVMDIFKLEFYGIASYELIKNCRFHDGMSNNINDRVYCPFLTRKKIKKINADGTTKKKNVYICNFPDDVLIIYDEAHRCKNNTTINADLLKSLCNYSVKILLLSATVSDKESNFAMAGYTLGLFPSIRACKPWLRKVGKNYQNPLQGVNNILYPEYASRMKIKELGDVFPVNKISADCYDSENSEEIEQQYQLIEECYEHLKNRELKTEGLGRLVIIRMKIEMLKAPILIDLAKKFLEEHNSVAIFVNYTETLSFIAQELKTDCIIYGEQSGEQRDENIKRFMTDECNIIVCNIAAGGVGISLHDTIGNFPRVSIISPSWNATDIVQVIGRINRANTKTPVRQYIVYCKNTLEESICENMKYKIENLGCLNDGNTESIQIEGLTDNSIGSIKDMRSEQDKIKGQIEVLNIKKNRLEQELRAVNDNIYNLQDKLKK